MKKILFLAAILLVLSPVTCLSGEENTDVKELIKSVDRLTEAQKDRNQLISAGNDETKQALTSFAKEFATKLAEETGGREAAEAMKAVSEQMPEAFRKVDEALLQQKQNTEDLDKHEQKIDENRRDLSRLDKAVAGIKEVLNELNESGKNQTFWLMSIAVLVLGSLLSGIGMLIMLVIHMIIERGKRAKKGS
jgi:Fe2+ transport system protein B